MEDLFRREAIEVDSSSWMGRVVLSRPPGAALMLSFAVSTLVCVAGFLFYLPYRSTVVIPGFAEVHENGSTTLVFYVPEKGAASIDTSKEVVIRQPRTPWNVREANIGHIAKLADKAEAVGQLHGPQAEWVSRAGVAEVWRIEVTVDQPIGIHLQSGVQIIGEFSGIKQSMFSWLFSRKAGGAP
jgi:hypothetical protein